MGLKEWLEDEYDEGLEKGKAIGIAQGISQGITQGKALGEKEKLISLVKKKLAKGNTIEEITDILEEDISVIREIVAEINAE